MRLLVVEDDEKIEKTLSISISRLRAHGLYTRIRAK
jgi:hypothetical protein